MKPYSLALLIYRLVAISLILLWIYGIFSFLLSPAPVYTTTEINRNEIANLRTQSLITGAILAWGSGILLYFASPFLARLTVAGAKE